MYILGINAYHGDAAAAIVRDGELIAAVEEERFNRVKHCAGFPTESVKYCLSAAGIGIEEVEHIGISRDPAAHLHKKILFAARRVSGQWAVGSGQGEEGRKQKAEGRKQKAESRRQKAESSGQWAVGGRGLRISNLNTIAADEEGIKDCGIRSADLVHHEELALSVNLDAETRGLGDAELARIPKHDGNGNGNGAKGVFSQIRDRLANAAKIRDLKSDLAKALGVSKNSLQAQFHNVEHHRAHLASSFYVSPFDSAALLSIDGFGDFVSTMWGTGEGNHIEVLGQVEYPHSTGIVYTATTQFLGFPHYGDEGKVMGLAPYGEPRFIKEFRDIIRICEDGKFSLNLEYFRHHAEGVEMSWDQGRPVIGQVFSDEYARTFGPPRAPGAELTDRERDIAASLQRRLEEVAFHVLNHLHAQTGLTDLGLSGGVAYNSVMNGKILLHTPFRRVFVQPAAGDSGTAIGACYHIYNELLKQPRSFVMDGAFTGPEFSNEEICAELERSGLSFEVYSDREVTQKAAQDIANGAVLGWFQGRMEFGPRALGNRSIIVDPRRAEMKEVLNERVKKREPFRPFAPSILEEYVGDYFEQTHPAPTMLMVYQIKPERRTEVPAVTHVDGSGRLQTVSRAVNERYHQLISDFYQLTGVPVVLNTSFNENEPIVCTPRQAIDCFLKTRMDVLYVGNHVVRLSTSDLGTRKSDHD
jgi:carbamoyltransferase